MEWRLKSWTYYFNFLLVGIGLLPEGLTGFSDETKNLLIITGLTNISLREKTQRKVSKE